MRRLLLGMGLSTMLGFGFGCGDRTASEQACADYAAAYCDKSASCRDWWVHAVWGDAATCNDRVKAQCLTILAAPSSSRTAASTTSCANATRGVSCNDFLDGKLPDACVPKPGGLADGEACGDHAQCASSFCAKGENPCGVCAPQPGAGADCINGCGPGLECNESGTCAAAAPLGAACGAEIPCTFGSTCMSGTCTKDLGGGDPCDDHTAACDPFQALACVNGRCKPTRNADPGATCGVELDATMNVIGFIFCAKSGTCSGYDPTHGQLTGICVAPAPDGATCGGTAPDCLPPAICSSDRVCTLPDPAACN